MTTVFKWMPKKASEVEGPFTLDGLIGSSSLLYTANSALGFYLQILELAGPIVKKLPK